MDLYWSQVSLLLSDEQFIENIMGNDKEDEDEVEDDSVLEMSRTKMHSKQLISSRNGSKIII